MLLTFIINLILVVLIVFIHYEMLYHLSFKLPDLKFTHRYRVLIGVFVIFMTHTIEIWLFALVYYLMINTNGFGSLTGNFDQSLLDCAYFSFTNYTTLGYGDIEPSGHIRFLAVIESLTGLIMITWSASFLFLEMQKDWRKN